MLKILYIDDEGELCQMFAELFSSTEIQITTFTEPDRAIASCQGTKYDLAMIDYRLPGTTGIEVASRLPSSIKKALITGELSLDSGSTIDRVFHKPLDIAAIEVYLEALKSAV